MGRYTGPKAKIARREGMNIFGLPKITRVLTKRNYPPGVHGVQQGARKPKMTEFGTQLREKQRMKRTYGLLERQFKNYFEKAKHEKGELGHQFHTLLELRLDNVVYRLGLAASRAQARQLVSHGHIEVNGKKVNVPSYTLRVGDAVSVREKSKSRSIFSDIISGEKKFELPTWLTIDAKELKGKVTALPPEEELKGQFDIKLIIEFYSR